LIGIHLNLFENNSISDKIESKKEGNYNDPLLIDLSMTMIAYRLNTSYITNGFHCILGYLLKYSITFSQK
jgi:hypothetical protein